VEDDALLKTPCAELQNAAIAEALAAVEAIAGVRLGQPARFKLSWVTGTWPALLAL